MSLQRHLLLRWWGGWLLATTALCLAFSTRYFASAQLDAAPHAVSFRVVMLVAHLSTLCALLLSPALLLALLRPRPRLVIPVAVLCAALAVLALLVDTQVFTLYRFHINPGVLNLLLGGAARETFIFPGVMYAEAIAIALAVSALLTGLAWALWRRVLRTTPNPPLRRATTMLILACLLVFHGVHIWADAVAHEPILEQTSVLPMRYAATAKRFLRARGFKIEPRRKFAARPGEKTELAYPLHALECRGPDQPYNIVFILIDSWRFDEMNARATPNIARFGQQALRFSNHRSGGNATRIGVFSLFYGIPGTYWHPMLRERRGPVFIEQLQRQSYDIGVFRSAPIYSPEFDRTVFAQVKLERLRSEGKGPADWDRDLTEDFLDYLDERDDSKPFFALLFYDSPHSFQMPAEYPRVFQPSAPHVNYLRLDKDTDATPLLNLYRNSLHYVDSLVGTVLAELRARGLLEHTIVLITGDHGQEFNDTGLNFWGHGSNFTRFQTGVPLILHLPGRGHAVVDHPTTHFDVVPTLLRDHFRCTTEFSAYSVGRSLLDPANRHPLVLSEYADFAIVQDDGIAVVREQGMKMFAPNYEELDRVLDPRTTRAALEQKTRFFKSATWRHAAGGDDAAGRPSLH